MENFLITVKEETAATQQNWPELFSARHTCRQEGEVETRQRQTDSLCANVFSFFGLMCLRLPIDGLEGVSSPPLHHHHLHHHLLLQEAD